jgi:hypothetical protein
MDRFFNSERQGLKIRIKALWVTTTQKTSLKSQDCSMKDKYYNKNNEDFMVDYSEENIRRRSRRFYAGDTVPLN